MIEQTSEALRAWFKRAEPLCPELFNTAYAICGSYDQAEYALRAAMLEVWSQNADSGMGFREKLRAEVREEAMDALADLYGLCAPGDWEAAIRFGDSVFEDTGAEFDRLFRLTEAGILKPEKLLGWYFGVDEDRAAQEYLGKGGNTWRT